MAHEVWEEYYDRLAELISAHRTTLVFVNTRRMAERAGAAPERAARRGRGHRAPRQPVEGDAARRRERLKTGAAEGARRHGVARARHRHRPRRSGLPDRIAAPDRDAAAARRPLGPHDRRHAEGAAVPGVARRPGRVRGAAARRSGAASSTRSSRTTRRSTCWRSRSSPKRACRDYARGRAVRAGPRARGRIATSTRATSTRSCAMLPRASRRAAAGARRWCIATRSTRVLRGRRGVAAARA